MIMNVHCCLHFCPTRWVHVGFALTAGPHRYLTFQNGMQVEFGMLPNLRNKAPRRRLSQGRRDERNRISCGAWWWVKGTLTCGWLCVYKLLSFIESRIMALSIKNADVELQIRRLAQRERISITGAIKLAVTNELQREEAISPETRAMRDQSINDIQAMFDPDKVDWSLSNAEILGHGSDGLPV